MAKVLKIVGAVVAIAGLAIVTGGAALGLGLSLGTSVAGLGVSAGALLAAGAVINAAGSLLAPKPKAPDVSTNNADRLTASIDLRAARKIVFGTTAMATDIRDQEFTDSQGFLHRWVVVASHKVNAITEIWFDDKQAWTASGGVTSDFTGYLTVTTVLEGSAANAINISARMGSSRRFTGCAYVYFRYKLTGNDKKTASPFAQSVSSRITIIGNGALTYDARLDSTRGGSGAHRADDQTTWSWNADASRNPALCLLWYMLGWRIQNPVTGGWKLAVGKGIPPERIDFESFITAANLCDEPVGRSAGGTEPRYRCDGIFGENDDPELVLDNLKACMNAVLDDVDGKIRLTVLHNDLASPIGSLTTDDVLGEFRWDQTPPLSDTFNVIRGGYTDASPQSLYQLVDGPDQSFPSPDGIDRIETINLPLVQSSSQRARLLKQRLQRMLYSGTFSAEFQATAWKYQKGDVIRLTFAPLGFSNKLFRIADMAIRVDGVVPMVLREENAAIYAWDNSDAAAVVGAEPTRYDPLLSAVLLGIDDLIAAAAAAQATADAAAAGIDLLNDDGVLTVDEKIRSLIPLSAELQGAWAALDGAAAAVATSTVTAARTAAATARTAWLAVRDAITPAWDDTDANSPVGRDDYDIAIANYRAAINALASALQSNALQPIGQNTVVNSSFVRRTFAWLMGASPSPSFTFAYGVNLTSYFGKRNVMYLFAAGALSSAQYVEVSTLGKWGTGNVADMRAYSLPVKVGSRIAISAEVSCHRCVAELYTLLFAADGTYLGGVPVTTGFTNDGAGGGDNLGTMRGIYTVTESTAAYAQFMIRMKGNGGTDPYLFFADPFFSVIPEGQTAFPLYAHGPSDPNADRTADNVAGGYAGQTEWGTYTGSVRGIAAPQSNLMPYPRPLADGRAPASYGWYEVYFNGGNDLTRHYFAPYGGSYYRMDRTSGPLQTTLPYFNIAAPNFPGNPASVSFNASNNGASLFNPYMEFINAALSTSLGAVDCVLNATTGRWEASTTSCPAGTSFIRVVMRATFPAVSGVYQSNDFWALKVEQSAKPTPYTDSENTIVDGSVVEWNNGQKLNVLKPQEGGANVTEGRVAAAIAGQTGWATLGVTTARVSYLNDNGTLRLGNSGGLVNASGAYWLTDENTVTANGTAAAIAGQAWAATNGAQALVDNRVVPLGENVVENSGFARALGSFRSDAPVFGLNLSGDWYGKRNVAYIYSTGAPGTSTYYDITTPGNWPPGSGSLQDLIEHTLPVKGGDRVFCSVMSADHRFRPELYILYFDRTGAFFSAVAQGAGSIVSGAQYGDNMGRMTIFHDVPSGAAFAQWMFRGYGTAQADPYLFFAEPMLCLVQPGQTAAPPYVPGPGGMIDGRSGNTNTNFGLTGLRPQPALTDVEIGGALYLAMPTPLPTTTDWGQTVTYPAISAAGPIAYGSVVHLWRDTMNPGSAGESYGITYSKVDAMGPNKAYLGFLNARGAPGAPSGGYGGGTPGLEVP